MTEMTITSEDHLLPASGARQNPTRHQANGPWDSWTYSVSAAAAPLIGGVAAIAICLLASTIMQQTGGFAVMAFFGIFIGLPAYLLLGLPAFRFAVRRSSRTRTAILLNVVCVGQLTNLLAFPLYLLVPLAFGAGVQNASNLALGYMIGGATLGLLNCIAFGVIYGRLHPYLGQKRGDRK